MLESPQFKDTVVTDGDTKSKERHICSAQHSTVWQKLQRQYVKRNLQH